MAAFKVFLLLAAGVAGVQCACTQGEVQTLMACLLPYNDPFIAALGQKSQGSTCNRTLITDALCRSYTNIVTCANGAQVSDTTCRPSAISQINANLVIPCMIEDFQAVCTDSPDINTGGSSSIQPGWTTANTRGAGGSGSIHAGWTTVLVIAVAQVVALLSSASFH